MSSYESPTKIIYVNFPDSTLEPELDRPAKIIPFHLPDNFHQGSDGCSPKATRYDLSQEGLTSYQVNRLVGLCDPYACINPTLDGVVDIVWHAAKNELSNGANIEDIEPIYAEFLSSVAGQKTGSID